LTLEKNQVLAGGGAPEIELAMTLRDYATTFGGREQLSVRAFANAMEIIPKRLLKMLVEIHSTRLWSFAVLTNRAIEMLVYQWTVR